MMTPTLLLASILATFAVASAETPDDPGVRRFALVVGANDGGQYRVRLRYAHADARAVAGVLTDLGGVEPKDRIALYDPDVRQLSEALDDLATRLGEAAVARKEVLFYYSGHSDETSLLLGEERYDYDDLRASVGDLPADVRIAILDSCASGALVRGKGGRKVAPFLVDESRAVEGHAFITSSSADESAQEADRLSGSYFTHYLVTGLRGAADVSRDDRVTLHEAYQYAFDETLAQTSETMHGAQHANYDFQLVGTGDLVLTDLTRTSASLGFSEELEGRAYVRDEGGHLVAELFKPAGRPIVLGLAPGRYVVTLTRDGEFGRVGVELEEDGEVLITPAQVVWNLGEVAVARGGDQEVHWRHAPVRFQLIPVGGREVVDHFTINFLSGRSGRLQGAAVGLGANFVDRDAKGAMLTIGGNFTGGDMAGLQGSVGYNHAGGDAGLQLTVGANVAEGRVRVGQASVGFNIAGGDVSGFQTAVGFNAVDEPVRGLQAAVGANIAPRSMYGVQLSSGVNYAGGLRGTQIGIVNVGGDVHGAQIGIVNVGAKVRGAQIGIVNISDEIDGVPIGLVSVSKRGRFNVTVFGSESTLLNADLKMGSRHVYSLAGIGHDPSRHTSYALGLGGQIPAGAFFIDLDAAVVSFHDTEYLFAGTTNSLGVRGRATLGLPFGKHFSPVAGVTFTYQVPIDGERVPVAPVWMEDMSSGELVAWPGFFAGIQF
jgi:uncharacterized caspase-like protein